MIRIRRHSPVSKRLTTDFILKPLNCWLNFVATHSPALADRLRPEELVVCERLPDGSSAIPAISVAEVRRIVRQSEGLPLGELWFSGALGGDL
jgi:hypothetical protein